MADIVLPNEGLADQLAYIVKATISGVDPWQIMLFQNDITPDQDTVYADLTEATFDGYSRYTLTRSEWQSPTIVADKAVSTYGTVPLVWIAASAGETIYGYALVTQTSPVIRAIQRFGSPPTLAVDGILAVFPTYRYTTMPP